MSRGCSNIPLLFFQSISRKVFAMKPQKRNSSKDGKQNKLLLSIRLEVNGDFTSSWFKVVIITCLIIGVMFMAVALFKVATGTNTPAKPSMVISV